MPDQQFNIGDRVRVDDLCGEVVAVLSPQQLLDSSEAVPRYRVRLDNGQAVTLAQNDLQAEGV